MGPERQRLKRRVGRRGPHGSGCAQGEGGLARLLGEGPRAVAGAEEGGWSGLGYCRLLLVGYKHEQAKIEGGKERGKEIPFIFIK